MIEYDFVIIIIMFVEQEFEYESILSIVLS